MTTEHMSLGDRMKMYEDAARAVLPPRMPVILRVDGKAFGTYTKGCKKPFDANFSQAMMMVAVRLCEEIQGAQMAYVQSDEVSVLIHSYKKFSSRPWFGNKVQKMVSVAGAYAASRFTMHSWRIFSPSDCPSPAGYMKEAAFDARVAAYPEADVCNYFVWRQQDATRNSIQMLARSMFSHKECDERSTVELKEMCTQRGVVWEDLDTHWKRGACVNRIVRNLDPETTTSSWEVDMTPPIFVNDRNYIDRHLKLEEE